MKIKKIIAAAFALMLLMSASVSASYDCEYLGDLPESELGVDVDALKDDVYDNALVLEIKREYPGEEADPIGTNGKAWLVYYNNNIYAYVEVYDSDIVIPDSAIQTSVPWETDSVEIFLNTKNSDSAADTIQHRIDVTGWPCIYTQSGVNDYGPSAVSDRFEYAKKDIPGGYAVEFGFATDSRTFAIQLQINDKTSDGNLYHVMSASEYDSESWTAEYYPWTSVNGEGKETAAPTEPVTDAVTQESATEKPASTTPVTKAPATDPAAESKEPAAENGSDNTVLWITIGGAFVAIIAIVCFIVLKKKKT